MAGRWADVPDGCGGVAIVACDEAGHVDLQQQLAMHVAEVGRLTIECADLRVALDQSSSLPVAIAEYQRRCALVQATQSRLDQTLALLAAGYAVIASGVVAAFSGLWPDERVAFYLASALLVVIAGLFTIAVFMRDLRSRLYQTESEQAQSRLRNFFIRCSPQVLPYLSDTIYDDWPTPYLSPGPSSSYWMWRLMLASASGLALAATCLSLLSLSVSTEWSVAVAITVGLLCYSALILALRRHLRGKAARYIPQFPRPQ